MTPQQAIEQLKELSSGTLPFPPLNIEQVIQNSSQKRINDAFPDASVSEKDRMTEESVKYVTNSPSVTQYIQSKIDQYEMGVKSVMGQVQLLPKAITLLTAALANTITAPAAKPQVDQLNSQLETIGNTLENTISAGLELMIDIPDSVLSLVTVLDTIKKSIAALG